MRWPSPRRSPGCGCWRRTTRQPGTGCWTWPAVWRPGCPRCPAPCTLHRAKPPRRCRPARRGTRPIRKNRPRRPWRRMRRRMPPERRRQPRRKHRGARNRLPNLRPKRRSRNPPPRKGSGRRPTPRPLRKMPSRAARRRSGFGPHCACTAGKRRQSRLPPTPPRKKATGGGLRCALRRCWCCARWRPALPGGGPTAGRGLPPRGTAP